MAINTLMWDKIVSYDFPNKYPCPKCQNGRMNLVNGSLNVVSPDYSLKWREHDDWEPYWDIGRFIALLKCDNLKCGEISSASGLTVTDFNPEFDDVSGYSGTYESFLDIKSIHPAPHLFNIDESVPYDVKKQIISAFELYWSDVPSSVGKLRNSLELSLDHLQVSRLSKKQARLDLNSRINLFESQNNDPDIVDSMQALRNVGNFGAHGDAVALKDYFDLLEVYEHALAEIFGKRSAKLKAKRVALKSLK